MPSTTTYAVLGAGTTAPGVAASLASTGRDVVVIARRPERAKAAGSVAAAFSGATVEHRPLHPDSFVDVAVIVECVTEALAVKRELLSRVEGWTHESCLLTTNTSSLRISDLADGLARPDRLVGLHFLHPAHLTALVEVVPGKRTSPAAMAATTALVREMGKQPLVLQRDVPGFIWNRLQAAVLRECVNLLDQGVASVEDIDAAVSDGLAPRWLAAGPLATRDLGGAAVFRTLAESLFPVLGTQSEAGSALTADKPFYGWTPQVTAQVEALRGDTLRAGSTFAARRREAAPTPLPDAEHSSSCV